MPEIRIPSKCDSPMKRWAFCIRAKRIFIDRIHNVIGKWHREGLTLEEYNTLPQKVKNRLPYQPQLTRGQWDVISDKLELYLEARILTPLLRFMKEVESSTEYDPDVDKEDLVE